MKKITTHLFYLFVAASFLFSCHVNKQAVVRVEESVIPDSLITWIDSLNVRALDSIQDSTIYYSVREFRSKLTSRYKKGGNAAMAIALIDELEKQEYYAHSRIDTFRGTLAERVPFITLKADPEIYPWFCVSNKAGVSIPRNGDTEYKIVTEITKRLGDQEQVDGDVTIFTELPPCNSCSHVIYLFNKRYPVLDVEVLYSPYGRILPLKKK